MGKKLYVFSTLASSVSYPLYGEAVAGGIRPVLDEIKVRGGAGVVASGEGLLTPRGVVTAITEEQAAMLRKNDVFKLHEKNGFVAISADELTGDAAAALLEGRDHSAPVVPQDYERMGGMKPPTVDGGDEESQAVVTAPKVNKKR